VEAKAQQALDCEQDNIELVVGAVTAVELKELCLNAQSSSADPAMPSTSATFKIVEDAKAIRVDDDDDESASSPLVGFGV
jgi:hypothetical protein